LAGRGDSLESKTVAVYHNTTQKTIEHRLTIYVLESIQDPIDKASDGLTASNTAHERRRLGTRLDRMIGLIT